MVCNKNHQNLLPKLPHDQGGSGRHKCCGCAYDKGYFLGFTGNECWNLKTKLENLPESQKYSQITRHRSASISYMLGIWMERQRF